MRKDLLIASIYLKKLLYVTLIPTVWSHTFISSCILWNKCSLHCLNKEKILKTLGLFSLIQLFRKLHTSRRLNVSPLGWCWISRWKVWVLKFLLMVLLLTYQGTFTASFRIWYWNICIWFSCLFYGYSPKAEYRKSKLVLTLAL